MGINVGNGTGIRIKSEASWGWDWEWEWTDGNGRECCTPFPHMSTVQRSWWRRLASRRARRARMTDDCATSSDSTRSPTTTCRTSTNSMWSARDLSAESSSGIPPAVRQTGLLVLAFYNRTWFILLDLLRSKSVFSFSFPRTLTAAERRPCSNRSISAASRTHQQQNCCSGFAAVGPCWDRQTDRFICPTLRTMRAVPIIVNIDSSQNRQRDCLK